MLISLLLLACTPVTGALPEVGCDAQAQEVQWIEGRGRYTSLARALESNAPWMTLCLGEGDFLVDEELLELASLSGSVHLIGRGPGLTRIVADPDLGAEGGQLPWPGSPLDLVFQDLEIATPMEITAQSLTLKSVTLQGVQASGGLLRLDAQSLQLRDVLVQDCTFAYGGITTSEALEGGPVRIDGLRWADNVSTSGLHMFFEGERDVRFEGLELEEVSDLSSGYPMLYGFGEMEVIGAHLERVRVGGPILSSRVLRVSDTEILESRSSSGGLIQVAQGLHLDQVSIQDSRTLDSLLTAYKGSAFPVEIQILDSHFGTEVPNAVACDLSVAGRCVAERLGAVETWECSYCTESLP